MYKTNVAQLRKSELKTYIGLEGWRNRSQKLIRRSNRQGLSWWACVRVDIYGKIGKVGGEVCVI